jgi:hypothetical protein
MSRRERAIAGFVAPFVGAAAFAAAAGCSSSSDSAPASSGVHDASIAEASAEAGRTDLKLIWQVVTASPLLVASGDAGGTAGSDAMTDAGAGSASDAAEPEAEAAVDGDSADATSSGVPDASDGGGQGIEGVEVCVYQKSSIPCVMTDKNGIFTLTGLPAFTDIVLTLKKSGYLPNLKPIETASDDMDGLSTGQAISMGGGAAPTLPLTVDWLGKGQVIFFAVTLGPTGNPSESVGDVGATVTLSPASSDGPYYLGPQNTLEPSATSIVDTAGLFFNLDPGTYEVTFHDPTKDCAPISTQFGGFGFPSPPSSVKFPILAGYLTNGIGVACTPKSVLVNTDN